MDDQLRFLVGSTSKSAARVYLSTPEDSQIESITGTIAGPRCEFSRTLPAQFSFGSVDSPRRELVGVEALIVDPCYWTPEMPFLYDICLQLVLHDGQEIEYSTQVGLRQWDCVKGSFYLQSRRTVLRGTRCHELSLEAVRQARVAESALIVSEYDQMACEQANRLGVILVVDFRGKRDFMLNDFRRVDWWPAVFIGIVDGEQLSEGRLHEHLPRQCRLAQCLTGDSTAADLADPRTEVLAVEFDRGQRPRDWMAKIDRPVIAIQRWGEPTVIERARGECDKLQAALAPEFDLAGYFVG